MAANTTAKFIARTRISGSRRRRTNRGSTGRRSSFRAGLGRPVDSFTLNGQALAGPMPQMAYKTVPAVDPALLKAGDEVLVANFAVANQSTPKSKAKDITVAADARLLALAAGHLQIQSGPDHRRLR